MSMEPTGRKPLISRHATSRRRQSAAPAAPSPEKLFPGLKFRPTFTGGRKGLVDLTRFPRSGLAKEAARMIWEDWSDGAAYKSPAMVEDATQMLARLGEFLPAHDPGGRLSSFARFEGPDIDAFDDWLHDHRFDPGSISPYARLASLVKFLNRAVAKGRAPAALTKRLTFVSGHHDHVPTQPRDAYDEFTSANLRRAARADAVRVLTRMRKGRRMARRGGPPEREGWSSPSNVAWELANRGMVSPERFKELERTYRRRATTAPQLLDLAYLGVADCAPFLILLADATGLPIESVRELKADCLEDPGAPSGFTKLRYVKRRRSQTDERFEESVATRQPFSAGWLVRRLLAITAGPRRELGLGEREGPLLLGRVGIRVQPIHVNFIAVAGWLRRNPVATDDAGGTLNKLVLSRIRKSHKAHVEYIGGGGTLQAIRKDHTTATFVKHYGNIPFLRPRHEDAAAAGIQEAHDAAMLPHVLVGPDAERLGSDPAAAARALGTTEARVRDVANGASDAWVAGCLDFHDSPYAEKGRPCGAPLFGCLDCANAIITASKLPGLIRLSNHFAAQRQAMGPEDWKRRFGFAYARILQILNLFPEAEVLAAMAEADDEGSRDWVPAQLAYRMGAAP